ncbi:MAG: Fic family protein [Rhodobacter sp.]|nr:Fic family protein [Rhodobacter sp.]
MDLYELTGRDESHPSYHSLKTSNAHRYQHFLHSTVLAALETDRPVISHSIIKAINFHAIAGLHHDAGTYRPCQVAVGPHTPPEFYRVEPLMDDFINMVNRRWDSTPLIDLAALALWRINYIHPFINGNGRTARAVCYFILCVKAGQILPGREIVPELMQKNEHRPAYEAALREADKGDIHPLTAFVADLLRIQIDSVAT